MTSDVKEAGRVGSTRNPSPLRQKRNNSGTLASIRMLASPKGELGWYILVNCELQSISAFSVVMAARPLTPGTRQPGFLVQLAKVRVSNKDLVLQL